MVAASLLAMTPLWSQRNQPPQGLAPESRASSARPVPGQLRFEPTWREPGDCGPLSLYVLMRLSDRRAELKDVKRVLPVDPRLGCSLADMARAAEKLGFPCQVRFVNSRQLGELPFPFILHSAGSLKSGTGHFLVVVGQSADTRAYSVIDTDLQRYRGQTQRSLLLGFSGYVLLPKDSLVASGWTGVAGFTLVGMGSVFALAAALGWFLRHRWRSSAAAPIPEAASDVGVTAR